MFYSEWLIISLIPRYDSVQPNIRKEWLYMTPVLKFQRLLGHAVLYFFKVSAPVYEESRTVSLYRSSELRISIDLLLMRKYHLCKRSTVEPLKNLLSCM